MNKRRITLTSDELSETFSKFTNEAFFKLKQDSIETYKYYCKLVSLYMEQQQLWDLVLQIIKQSKAQRIKEEVDILVNFTQDLKFFQQLNTKQRNVDNKLHYKICQNLEHEFYPQGSVIFKQNDAPAKFYIILEGSVNIYLIKEQSLIHQQSMVQHAAMLVQVTKQRSIEQTIEQLKSARERYLIKQLTSSKCIPVRNSLSQSPSKEIKNEEAYKQILTQTNVPPQSIEDFDFYFYKGIFRHRFITTLPSGSMFGELGILMNKGRTASIVAAQDTELAVLDAKYYRNFLREIDLKKVQQRVEFFTQYFFKNMPFQVVMKYCYNFEKLKLVRGDVVYQQNTESSSVYLILKGEIKFIRKQSVITNNDQLQYHLQATKKIIEQCIYQIGQGEIFGELEILQDCQRLNSAICQSVTAKIYHLSAEIFHRLLKDNSNLKKNFETSSKVKQEWSNNRITFLEKTEEKINKNLSKTAFKEQKESSEREFENIQLPVQPHKLFATIIKEQLKKKQIILKLMGINLQSSSLPKQQIEMKDQLFQVSNEPEKFEHHVSKSRYYVVPPQVQKNSKESQIVQQLQDLEVMDRVRKIYVQNKSDKATGTKDFDDFKLKFSFLNAGMKQERTEKTPSIRNPTQGSDQNLMTCRMITQRSICSPGRFQTSCEDIPLNTKNSFFKAKCSSASARSVLADKVGQRQSNPLRSRQSQPLLKADQQVGGQSYNQNYKISDFTQNYQLQPDVMDYRKQISQQISPIQQKVKTIAHKRQVSVALVSNRQSSTSLIPSKHNLFRLKPSRQYLIESTYKRYKTDAN